MTQDYKYDLAISLCNEDAELGWKICQELGNPEKIFFYKKDVDDLTYKTGTNVFGEVFKKEARYILVLFRSSYGMTDWTALEYTLIADRYKRTIRTDNSPVLFCKLDNSPTPDWLGDIYIYDKYKSDKDLKDLTRRVRKHIIDHGGISFPKTTDEQLEQFYVAKRYNEQYKAKMYGNKELADKSQEEAFKTVASLKDRFKETAIKQQLRFGEVDLRHNQLPEIRIIFENVLLLARYAKTSNNSIDESDLYIELFTVANKHIIQPDMFSHCYREKQTICEMNLQFYITQNDIYGWRNVKEEFFSTEHIVESIFQAAVNYLTRPPAKKSLVYAG